MKEIHSIVDLSLSRLQVCDQRGICTFTTSVIRKVVVCELRAQEKVFFCFLEFLSRFCCCVLVVLVLTFGCICRWLSCVLLVVGCRLSVVECWPLVGCRWRWLLCWFLVVAAVGRQLFVVDFLCRVCRAVLLLSVPSSVYNCGEQYTVSQTTFFRY